MRICQGTASASAAPAVLLGMIAATSWRSVVPQNGNGHRAEPVEIWKARSFIRDHFADEISLGMVADTVHLSANYFSEQFKKFTGINFVDYIARLRIEKARELLGEADLRVTEIAFAVGFQSLSQFNRVFRKVSGQSPTGFRQALAHADHRSGRGRRLSVKMRSHYLGSC